jgi:trypsin
MKTNGELRDVVGVGTSHPLYNNRAQDYDFMVYKLASPVTNMKPVPLNSEFTNPSAGAPLTVIGFGSTFEGGEGSNSLQKVEVSNIAHSTCNFAYSGQVQEDIMFCAGGEGEDSCQGDSGGPIVDANGVQVGVTSWGKLSRSRSAFRDESLFADTGIFVVSPSQETGE